MGGQWYIVRGKKVWRSDAGWRQFERDRQRKLRGSYYGVNRRYYKG